ncbi:MAG: phosphatidate cytidylyltransferase [Mangrovibacterium sp.]
MKNLIIRSLSGAAFVAVTLGSLWSGRYGFAVFFVAVLTGSMVEFYRMTRPAVRPLFLTGISAGILLFILSFLSASGTTEGKTGLIFFPFLLLTFIAELFRNREHAMENVATGILGVVYIALPLSLANHLVFNQEGHYSPDRVILLLVMIWIYDSGAYLAGVSMGKHRLFERISPKKSWEGAIGGLLITLAASALLAPYTGLSRPHLITVTFLVVLASTFGDLTESMLKRQFGLKDSGRIIPGHGGLLDRFDSLLFAIPVFVAYLWLVNG